MRYLIFLFLPLFTIAQQPIAELLTVAPDGTLSPTGIVSTISSIAVVASEAQAALAEAEAVSVAAGMVSNAVAEIEALENARNATGYIRLFVESFSAGIEADTNLTASIVMFEPASNTVDHAYYNLWTYFTSDPGTWPFVRTAESIGRSNTWDMATSISVSLGEVQVGETLYEAYRNTIEMPLTSTSSFFRVYADVQGAGTNQTYFPVNNGIAVNGVAPFTGSVTSGTNTMRWVGGVRVQ